GAGGRADRGAGAVCGRRRGAPDDRGAGPVTDASPAVEGDARSAFVSQEGLRGLLQHQSSIQSLQARAATVPDIEAKLAEVTAAGATVEEPARDVGGGRLVANITDPDGNALGPLQDREVLRNGFEETGNEGHAK